MNNHICHSCSKRSSCDFAKDLDRALNGLGSMVSENIRAQIRELVANDVIACSDYNQDEAVNFGSAEDIDGEAVNIQDANGNFLWEK